MIYIACVLSNSVVGYITEESQKAFLLQCDENYLFYEFEWAGEMPPFPSEVEIIDGTVSIISS
jgi:hypothetical protein